MAQLSPGELRSQLETVLRDRQPEIVALAISADFADETLECRGRTYLVRRARSVLEFHDHVDQAQGMPLVCLTELETRELGLDLCSRLHRRRVLSVDPWETVKHLFDCRSIESSLLREPHLAGYLLKSQPPGGYSKVKGDVLTADKVWSCLFAHRLEMPADYLDTFSLLEWASGECGAYLKAPSDLKQSVRSRVLRICGEYGRAMLDSVEDGRLHPLALGLALRCLDQENPTREQEKALLRLEQYTGNRPLEARVVRDWAEAAERLQGSELDSDPRMVESAERLLVDLQAGALRERSDFLPGGLELRLQVVGQALEQALEKESALPDFEAAVKQCLSHRGLSEQQKESLEMLPRLVRWLHTPQGEKKLSLEQLGRRYANSTSFAAWARLRGEPSETQAHLDQPVTRLMERVVDRLESRAEQFAQALKAWNEAGEPDVGVWKVEEILDRVLLPIAEAKGGRFLLVVLDGCGWPTLQEIWDTFPAANWKSLEPAGDNGGLRPVLATYPSVTECSRTSLFSGSLVKGSSSTETQNFRDHPRLKAACNRGAPPLVFHKGELDGGLGNLSSEVTSKISNRKYKAVAVVVNTIDDHLDRDDQLRFTWTHSSIAYLQELCLLARASGRVLVLTSDHGHLLERGSELRKSSTPEGGARWRPGDSAGKGELVLRGPRVLCDEPGVVMPWSETVRYTRKKNGYHGGCHPAELLIPLLVLAPDEVQLEGWCEAHSSKPAWWSEGGLNSRVRKKRRPAAAPVRKSEPETGQMLLIEEPAPPEPEFADAVLDHPLIASKWKLHKGEPDLAWGRRLLVALDGYDGGATVAQLANEFGQPEARFRYLLGEAANLLSLDGQYLVSLTPDTQKVLLNRALFGAGTPPDPDVVRIKATRHGEPVEFTLPLSSIKANERAVVEMLAEFGQLSEEDLKKRTGSGRVGGMVARLIERLNRHGFPHLREVSQGDEGRIYRLEMEGVLR